MIMKRSCGKGGSQGEKEGGEQWKGGKEEEKLERKKSKNISNGFRCAPKSSPEALLPAVCSPPRALHRPRLPRYWGSGLCGRRAEAESVKRVNKWGGKGRDFFARLQAHCARAETCLCSPFASPFLLGLPLLLQPWPYSHLPCSRFLCVDRTAEKVCGVSGEWDEGESGRALAHFLLAFFSLFGCLCCCTPSHDHTCYLLFLMSRWSAGLNKCARDTPCVVGGV